MVMKRATLETWCRDDCTLGILTLDSFRCFTLELPWINNEPRISCIPAGVYRVKPHNSPSLGFVYHLQDVKGRTWIYIHKGNFTRQIEGCILVGSSIKYLDADHIPDIAGSSDAFTNLVSEVNGQEFELEITRVEE